MPQVHDVPNPDSWFWYAFAITLSTILGTILVIVITRYVNKTDSNFTLLTGIVEALKDQARDLKTMLTLHEHRLNGHDEDIKKLEDKYIVKYRKGG